MKENKPKFRFPMFVSMWVSVFFLAAGIVLVCYYAIPFCLAFACASFFLFAFFFSIFVYFAIRYSREISKPEQDTPVAH
jgi:hypothetical protein